MRVLVGYKAAIAGVSVIFVPPAYTSQTCSCCGHIHPTKGKSYRNGKMFKCRHYGFEHDADVNAAMNIAVGVSVSSPDLGDKLSTSGLDDSRQTVQNCGYRVFRPG